jgi:hypothetical protein
MRELFEMLRVANRNQGLDGFFIAPHTFINVMLLD